MTTDSALADFRKACACNESLLLEVVEPGQPSPNLHVLQQPFALIGREPSADVVCQNEKVSRRHAMLQIIGGEVFCLDLQSRTGTHWIDGVRPFGWIGPADPVRVGPMSIRVPRERPRAMPAVAWNPLDTCPRSQLPSPLLTLEFMNGQSRRSHWQIDRVLTLVGSSSGCKIRLRGRKVSELHCYFMATPSGVWIVDLLSSSGVFHKGVPVRFAQLQDGDQLVIGGFEIQARAARTSAAPGGGMNVRPDFDTTSASEQAPIGELQAWSRGPVLPLRLPVQGEMVQSDTTSLVSIMNQFSHMQMQMFEQFQQTMMMVFQMFGTLQQEQMATLRQEFDRVHELTRELQTLRDTLSRSSHVQTDQAHDPTSHAANVDGKPAVREPAPERARSAEPAQSGYAYASQAAKGNGAQGSAGPAKPAAKAAATDAKQPPPGQDLHAWLNQRMEALQQERQSRWEKIMGILGGSKKP